MKGILVTSNSCPPCLQIKEALADLIEKGEIEEVNAEKDPARVLELMNKYEVDIPGLLIFSENGELILGTNY